MTPKLALPDPAQDSEWSSIIDAIADELTEGDLPEMVIRATEMLLSGYSISEAAKVMEIRPSTIRQFITKYPTVARVLSERRQSLIRWRLSKIDQQFLLALKKSEEILETSLSGDTVDPKVLSAIGQHVRYILSLVAPQKVDITVTHEAGASIFQAQKEALDYVANQIAQQRASQEPVETIVRVIDGQFREGPLLTAEGQPNFGEMGILDTNSEGTICHACGKRYRNLPSHINNQHNLSSDVYEATYLLEPGSLNRSRQTEGETHS